MNRFLILLLALSSFNSFGQAEKFVASFLNKKGLLTNKKNFLQFKKSQSSLLNNYNFSELNITPNFSSTDYTFPTNSFGQKNYNLDFNFDQSFSTGTQLHADLDFNNAQRSDEDLEQRNSFWRLSLSQSLLQNWNGKLDKSNNAQSLFKLNQNNLQINKEQVKQCHIAIQLYNKTYYHQERLKVLSQVKSRSQDIHYLNQKKYKKKLIDRLNYLLSKRNWQENNNSFINAQAQFNKQESEYSFYTPYHKLNGLFLDPIFKQSSSLEINEKQQQIQFLQNQLGLIESKNKIDIELELGTGKSERKNDYSFSVEGDNERSFYDVGVNIKIPLSSPNTKREINENRYQYLKNKNNLKNLEQRLDLKNKLYKKSLEQIKNKIGQYKLLQKTNRQLLNEADHQLKINKLSFRDYLSYLNQFLRNKLNIVEHQYLYNKSILDFATLNSTPISICKKFVHE